MIKIDHLAWAFGDLGGAKKGHILAKFSVLFLNDVFGHAAVGIATAAFIGCVCDSMRVWGLWGEGGPGWIGE